MAGTVNHRLLELIHEKEKQEGRRIPMAEHAREMGVSKRSLERWLNPDKPTKRFDADMLAAFCKYFNVQIEDILVYVPEGAE